MRLPRSALRHNAVLEWELARQWNGISDAAWEAMSGNKQAYYVAIYRVKHHSDAIIAHDQAEKAKPKHSKYGRKG